MNLQIIAVSPAGFIGNRRLELAVHMGVDGFMVNRAMALQATWFDGKFRVDLTADAWSPEVLIQKFIAHLCGVDALNARKMNDPEESTKPSY